MGRSAAARKRLLTGAVLLAGAMMLGQTAPAGNNVANCYHMHHTGPCGSNETSTVYLQCQNSSCPDWYTIAGEIYECVGCQGPDGWLCTNNGHVYYLKYEAYCTVPQGLCAYKDPIIQQDCISAVAMSACNCPP